MRVPAHVHLLFLPAYAPELQPCEQLWPFSDAAALTVPFQWALNAWPNVAISLVLLAHLFWLARKRGTSPIEIVSELANEAFVRTLRER